MRNLDILAAENGEHVRVLLCREEQSYVVSCQHFRMPYPVASDLLAELQPVPAESYSVFVLDEDITNRQREGRNRKLDLIAPLLPYRCGLGNVPTPQSAVCGFPINTILRRGVLLSE